MQCKCKCTLQVLARSAYAKTLGKSDLDAFARTRTRARGGGSNVALARISQLHPPYSPCPGARKHLYAAQSALGAVKEEHFVPCRARILRVPAAVEHTACSALCGAESVSSSTSFASRRRFMRPCWCRAGVLLFLQEHSVRPHALLVRHIKRLLRRGPQRTRTHTRARTRARAGLLHGQNTHTHATRCSAHELDSGGCMAAPVGHHCAVAAIIALLWRLLRRCGDYCAVAEDLCTRMGEALRE